MALSHIVGYPRIGTRDLRRDMFYRVGSQLSGARELLETMERLEPSEELRVRYGRFLRPTAGKQPDLHASLYR